MAKLNCIGRDKEMGGKKGAPYYGMKRCEVKIPGKRNPLKMAIITLWLGLSPKRLNKSINELGCNATKKELGYAQKQFPELLTCPF